MTQPLRLFTDSRLWDDWMASQNAHILQTFAWGEFKSRYNWRTERVALVQNDQLRAAAQILYRPLAPGLELGYIPRGPIVPNPADLPFFMTELKRHARARRVFMLKLEPDLLRGDPIEAHLQSAGAVHSSETVQPPATIRIDLTANLDTILARMKPKWRYNIRLAEKKGVTVRAGTPADFDSFHRLMQLTGERDHFAIHGAGYYRTAFELLEKRDAVRLLIAEYESQPLAMIFVTAFAHEAIYLYGASSNTERNRMPNHALHWAAIQWAQARGCTRYDLWGIPETADEQSDDVNLPSSLYQFKQGFGGEVIHYTGAWDFIFSRPLHELYKYARRTRKSSLG